MERWHTQARLLGTRQRGEWRMMDVVDGEPFTKTGDTGGVVPANALLSVSCT